MLLKRLITRLPSHLADLVPTLEHYGIKTTENVLYTPRQTLFHLVKALRKDDNEQLSEVTEDDLEELVSFCLAISVDTERGDLIWETERTRRSSRRMSKKARFGVVGLDGLMGDFDSGIVEISGPKRVGKSLLALHVALRALSDDDKARCHWVDTEGSFNPVRAQSVLESWGASSDTVASILDRLIITPCFQLDPDLYGVLASIASDLNASEGEDMVSRARARILVIDPVTNLFKDMLMNSSAQGHASMVTTMEEIATMTNEHNLITIITNSTASSIPTNRLSTFSTTTIKPSLGTSFTYFSDISLLVQETGKIFGMTDITERERIRTAPGLRGVVEVLKSRVSPTGTWTAFETDGIKLLNVLPPPTEDERTLLRSAGMDDGERRPLFGALAVTLAP